MTDRIERLIGEMTLEEKIGQLNQVGWAESKFPPKN